MLRLHCFHRSDDVTVLVSVASQLIFSVSKGADYFPFPRNFNYANRFRILFPSEMHAGCSVSHKDFVAVETSPGFDFFGHPLEFLCQLRHCPCQSRKSLRGQREALKRVRLNNLLIQSSMYVSLLHFVVDPLSKLFEVC